MKSMAHRATALLWLTGMCLVAVSGAAQPSPTAAPPGEPAPAQAAQPPAQAADPATVPSPAPPALDPQAAEEALGLTRERRRLIQRGLATAGYDPGTPDGLFGDATRTAIELWQAGRGRQPTGFLDARAANDLQQAGAMAEQIDRAQAERDQIQTELDQTEAELDQTEAEGDRTQEQLDQTQAERDRAEAEREAAERQSAADRARYLLWTAVILFGGSALILILWVVSRRSVTRAQHERVRAETLAEVAQARVEERDERDRLASATPAVLLDGADADGRPIAVRVPGSAIAGAGGAVVGRNPFDSTVVIDHSEVSRRHFRLFARGASILLEDLNSTNGTAVNDTDLAPGTSAALSSGAILQVGGLTLKVTLQ